MAVFTGRVTLERSSALEDYSRRLMPVVDWQATDDGNVCVLSDTGDFYRFFDATPQTEFLYSCVRRTVETDLPEEASFLRCHDQFCRGVQALVDMPNRTLARLFAFLRQNQGRLSERARTREFAQLTSAEAARVEQLYRQSFPDTEG